MMIRIAVLAVLLLLADVRIGASQSAEEIADARLTHGEPSVGRTILALPYAAFALTAWPIKTMIRWMERVNLPQRVEDAALFPLRRTGLSRTPEP